MTRRKQKKEAKRITWNDDPEFERLIRFLFDRDDPKGAWRLEEPTPTLSDAQTVQYIHRLCATAEKELAPFSELQIAHGLQFIFDATYEYAYALRDGGIELQIKLDAIASMASLFRDCLNERCTQGSKLHQVCWMFWDETPLTWCERNPNKEAIYAAVADVMRQCLNLSNIICVKSALHGLGHLHCYHPEAAGIVRHFLNTTQRTDPDLLRYAEAAERGMVQ